MDKEIKYLFKYINACNMCGADSDSQKILGKRLNCSQGRNPQKKIGISTMILKCQKCGLVYSNPQPEPLNIQDHYNVPPANYWNSEYVKRDDDCFGHEFQVLHTLAKFESTAKSLDIGAGLGKYMLALAKNGFDSYGLEPSESFYDKAIKEMNINPDKLKKGMLSEISYPENHFDFITFGAVLEHVYDPSDSIVKAMKWLKPNGIMHIEVPSSNWLIGKIINLYYFLKGTDYVGNISPMHAPYHLYEFGLKSFQEHAEKNKYEVIFHQYYVCQTFMPKVIDPIVSRYMKWTNTGMQLTVWLQKK